MAFVRPIMRAALDRSGNPAEALERTNRILVDERRTGLFVTALSGVLDLATGQVRLANAGHEEPLVIPGDGSPVRSLPGSGPLLGVFGRLAVDEVRAELRPGDTLVSYTDGITDAMNERREPFGEQRLFDAARRAGGDTAKDVCRSIITAVTRHQGETPAADDLALLVVRRLR
jgi:sigma-B regulation protein RsbU (phosphoserine phosphatase)